ncbi:MULTISPECIES: acyltransferase family protein [Rahnella]|uniref:acyltransferase family protein n=1 Tax=Rahnella TaxID=34037 RepID=UPI003F6DB9AA
MNTKNDIHGLTIFRFIAAFYVFIFHCNLRFKADVPEITYDFINNGAVGMTFFFVLSGFVMSWSSRAGVKDNYFRSRLARIYPAYLFMGLVSLPFIFEYNIIDIPVYIGVFLTMSQSFFTGTFPIWNFGGSWSVSTEMFFYITFPLLFPIVKKNPLISLTVSIIASSLIIPVSIVFSGSSAFPQYYISPLHRLPEFISGVSLGCLYASGFRIKKLGIPLLLISITALVLLSPFNNEGWTKNNYITLPSTCIIVYILACFNIKKSAFTNPFIFLGKVSYSFYLMQLPIVLFTVKYHYLFDGVPIWCIWALLGVINLALAIVCYYFIERNSHISRVFITKKAAPNLN